MPRLRVLVAEDDTAIRDLLAHHLQRDGFDAICAADGNSALRAARNAADVVILDLGLPVIDGLDIARTLRRERRDMPILMLTARADEVDRIVGLEIGADDYIIKPFSVREVIARVRAVVRRMEPHAGPAAAVISAGRLEIHEAAREVRVDGRCVKMKPREYALLRELAANPGIALSRRALLDRCWGFEFCGDERTVDVHVRRLRVALRECGPGMPALQTVHGYGYKFVES